MIEQTKIFLSEREMPKKWYNVLPDLMDLKTPLMPPLHPATLKPIEPKDLELLFAMELIKQEVSQETWIDIPDELLNIYSMWRPSPLHRARRLEKALNTPAHIYFKNESVSPAGSHKPNTAVAQAYYNKEQGIKRISTETGAGQWGSALSFAGSIFGLEIIVYMVRVSYDQKPYRKLMMQAWGGTCYPSPSNRTEAGRKILEVDPNTTGTLGMAISEAVEEAATRDDTKYCLGSVLNHVLLHQTIIGLEVKKQMDIAGEEPDVLIGCVGGGSNFGGFALPYIPEKKSGKDIKIIAVEPTACPTLTSGLYAYDYGDTAKMAPAVMMHTLGHTFVPPGIHAGGLRYHGMAPIISLLVKEGLVEPVAYHQKEVFEAGQLFARTEGIIPAPETNHAIKATIEEAIKAREQGKEKTIVFNFSGHGHFDLSSYDKYFTQEMKNFAYPEEDIKKAEQDLPKVDIDAILGK